MIVRSIGLPLTFVVGMTVADFSGVIGQFSPVMTPASISMIEGAGDGRGRNYWRATSEKRRSCDFHRMEWFLGERYGGSVLVPSGFDDGPQIRETGGHEWDRLWIDLPPDDVINQSFSNVWHICDYGPFEVSVKTQWYDH